MPGENRHSNLKRLADNIASRACLGLPVLGRRKVKTRGLCGFVKVRTFLIEVWVAADSSFARHMPSQGGAAVRVCIPRYLAILLQQGVPFDDLPLTSADPPPAPKLTNASKVYVWRLDLRVRPHSDALLKWLADLDLPAKFAAMHLHTSPPCTPFSSITNMNVGREVDLDSCFKRGLTTLALARRMHRIWRKASPPGGVRKTSSHEQPKRASTTNARRRCAKKKIVQGVSWPWAISAALGKSRASVRGCAVDLMKDGCGQFCSKEWSFESDKPEMIKILNLMKCPGESPTHRHLKVIKEVGTTDFARASETAQYPGKLGAVLACAASVRFS